jgi:hypothetical protein
MTYVPVRDGDGYANIAKSPGNFTFAHMLRMPMRGLPEKTLQGLCDSV